MTPLDQRSNDRMSYYTMKTPLPPPAPPTHSHTLSNPPTLLSARQSNTPLASPKLPYSVGQPCPPKLSPSAGRMAARAPSPNYFGLAVENATDTRDSTTIPHENWSPPSSAVRTYTAALPKQLPLDANPEFEAFRRQIDANRGRAAFNLSTSNFAGFNGNASASPTSAPPVPSAQMRPRLTRWHTHGSDASETPPPRTSSLPTSGAKVSVTSAPASKMDVDMNSLPDSAYVSLDSKRNSEASLDPPTTILNTQQFESPAQLESPFPVPERRRSNISVVGGHHPSPPKILSKLESPLVTGSAVTQRADIAPPALEGGPSMMSPSQLRDLLECSSDSEVLILDVRVSPQYAQSRIKGALNLCIPTTLLKRATFNLQKLQQTFQGDHTQEKFANWRSTTHLVVYDACSPEQRDAVSATNMLKKFSNEGYTGSMNILRGGFNAFAASYPHLVDHSSTTSPASLSLGGNKCSGGAQVGPAPVIGGVMLPSNVGNVNPFFSNIRQNQDLVDGVGQLDIGMPSGLDSETLPAWLKDVAERADHGKKASDKFLKIELQEKSRMMDAYSAFNPATAATVTADNLPDEPKVQLSGVEKGVKNRYKDILPFEHARVHLQGKETGSCNYINASHLKASRSHKRYIATQGPLPATFEDFWSVIWDQDVRVIVMLTAESEGGQLKCHPYWTDKEFGPMKLRSLSEKKVSLDVDKHRSNSAVHPHSSQSSMSSNGSSSNGSFSWNTSQAEIGRRRANTTTTLESSNPTPAHPNLGNPAGAAGETPYVIIRKFALSHTAHPFAPIREITHLHYPSWPDFGAPAEPSHLLALVELANVMQRAALPIEPSRPTSTVTSPEGGNDQPKSAGGSSVASTSKRGSDAVPALWHDVPESNDDVRPMLVHCSAGCGRTGAFCTIDSVLDMLKRQRQRVVRKANKKLAEGEKRLAADQQLAEECLREKRRAVEKESRDGDGDTSMVSPADDEAISPLATFREPPLSHLEGWPDVANPPPPPTTTTTTTDDEDEEEDAEGIDTAWLDDDAVDLVASTVSDFREQRLSMVQSLRQFVLCYEAVLEWIWRIQQRGSGAAAGGRGRVRSGSLVM